jgi:TRAP-type C4-dicarboxylate transport system substrate-binding protein
MTLRRGTTAIALAALALATNAPRADAADPILLKYGDPGPPTASIHTQVIDPWSKKVTKESDGTLDVQVFQGQSLVSMLNAYDRVLNGVADFAFCIVGPISTQVPRTTVATLPFEAESAHEAGLALERLNAKGVLGDEWSKVKPIGFGVFANMSFHTKDRIERLEDLQGKKLSVQGRVAGQTVEALGGTPISLAVTELYQSLQRGVIGGVAIGWPATVSFKTHDFVHHHLRESLGGEAAMMIMNKETYARLSGQAKRAIDSNIGTVYTNWFNRVIDETEQENRAFLENAKDQEVHRLAPDERARWKDKMAKVVAEWTRATPDGDKVLAGFRKEIAAIRAGS